MKRNVIVLVDTYFMLCIILYFVVKAKANSAKLMLACVIKQRGAVQLRPTRTADEFLVFQRTLT